MRVCTVVGARPQFVKASVVSPALARAGISEYLVHTGQHYDFEMSQIFFRDLEMKAPDINLAVGSASHAVQTANMLAEIAQHITKMGAIDGVLVYGDTNSTLAATLAAAKLNIPVFHVEAGLRSYNKRMPEEQNRVITDRLASLLFCPTDLSVSNLGSEGIDRGVVLTGDVMYEAVLKVSSRVKEMALDDINPQIRDDYIVATVHRPSNVDNRKMLKSILSAFAQTDSQVVFPIHPRTRERMGSVNISDNIVVLPPLGHGDMIRLVMSARAVVTDSGGLQKEAYWLGTPCVTLRNETEWTETLQGNWNQLAGPDSDRILAALDERPSGNRKIADRGIASTLIAKSIQEFSDES